MLCSCQYRPFPLDFPRDAGGGGYTLGGGLTDSLSRYSLYAAYGSGGPGGGAPRKYPLS